MPFDHFLFPSGDHQLYAALYSPQGPAVGGVVLCAPFAEEQKTSYRTYAQLADRLAASGWATLHFDYAGTGDSSGNFTDFSPGAAKNDINAAVELIREKAGVESVVLFGLRLGAALALDVAEERGDIDRLILWQPITSGEEFFKLNIKRRLVRQMLMRSAAKKTGAADPAKQNANNEDAGVIDLDGYPLSRTACDELRKIELPPEKPAFEQPMLLLQISTSEREEADLRALADAYQLGDDYRIRVAEPLWLRLGVIDCSELIELTAERLRTH